MKNIVFDFDGTLVDTTALLREIANELLEENDRRERITPGEFQRLRRLTIPQLLKRFNVPVHQLPAIVMRVREKLHLRVADMKIIPGIPEVIKELHERGYTLGIVSSSSHSTLMQVLKRHDLVDCFDFIHDGVSLFAKSVRLKQVLRRHRLDRADTLYVGDEVRDIETARKAGVKIASVSWGGNERSVLAELKPDFVLDRPAQLLDY